MTSLEFSKSHLLISNNTHRPDGAIYMVLQWPGKITHPIITPPKCKFMEQISDHITEEDYYTKLQDKKISLIKIGNFYFNLVEAK